MQNVPYPKLLKRPLVRHGLFWMFIITFFTFPGFATGDLFLGRLLTNLCYVPIDMLVVYICLYLLLPRILEHRKFYTTALIYIILVILMAILSRYLKYNVYTFLPESLYDNDSLLGEYFNSALVINMIVGAAIGTKLLTLWYSMQIKSQTLDRQRSEAELENLRLQLNPHFLFNTLNNIDSLVLEDSEKGSEALIQLSEILRYAVYETRQEKVPLSKEIEYLKNYIRLQKIRLSNPDIIQVKIEGKVNDREIEPMLLIPIVENAFKHGDKEESGRGISICIKHENSVLDVEVRNGIRKNPNTVPDKGGIGLENLRRRLEIQYPGKHELLVERTGNEFVTILKLELS